MPKITRLLSGRALVNVLLKPTTVTGTPVKGKALLDSGATYSHIGLTILAGNHFRHIGKSLSDTASQLDAEVQRFEAIFILEDLSLTKEFHIQAGGFPVRTSSNPDHQLIALIGCDILSQGCFVYNGLKGEFSLEMP